MQWKPLIFMSLSIFRFPEYDDQQMLAQSHGTNVHETDVEALPCSILNVILGKENPSPHKVHFGLVIWHMIMIMSFNSQLPKESGARISE